MCCLDAECRVVGRTMEQTAGGVSSSVTQGRETFCSLHSAAQISWTKFPMNISEVTPSPSLVSYFIFMRHCYDVIVALWLLAFKTVTEQIGWITIPFSTKIQTTASNTGSVDRIVLDKYRNPFFYSRAKVHTDINFPFKMSLVCCGDTQALI